MMNPIPASTSAAQPDTELRPEARPRPFTALDPQQKAAFCRVVDLLYAATVAAPKLGGDAPPTRAGVPQIPDLDRSGRNILVDGERGTGKTTLLLSLARALLRRPEPYQEDKDEEKLPEGLGRRLGVLRRRLVWLETLDMEPLSDDTNLLGAVLARIEDAAGARLPAPDDATVTSLLYPTRDVRDIPRDLLRLQTSIALIFDGNLRARAGRLDPDTFAVEARRTERERLGLDRRFTDVLGALSAALDGKPELEDPVFVLPVDDLDLNPSDCVPLLRLLRSAHSPHLVVIMAADVGLLTTVLRLKYRGDFARISDPLKLSDEDRVRADDLADSAFRKHLPPSQQVHLALVEPAFALSYPVKAAKDRPILRAMRAIRLPPDAAQLSLDSRFGEVPGPHDAGRIESGFLPPPTAVDTGDVDDAALKADLTGFSWPEVLRLPMRQVIDLHLASVTGEAVPVGRVGDTEASAVRNAARMRLQRWRSVTADVHRLNDPEPAPAPRLSSEDIPVGPLVIRTSKFHGWRVQTPGGPLPPTDSSAYVGCLELAGDDLDIDPGTAQAPYMGPLRETVLPAYAERAEITVSWPWVRHSTYWAYERAARWLHVAERQWSTESDHLFGSWIAVMTAQLFPRPGSWMGEWTESQPRSWAQLDQRLVDLGESPLAGRWRITVGLLCTREMGLSGDRQLPRTVEDLTTEIEQRRRDRLRALPEPHRVIVDSLMRDDAAADSGPDSPENEDEGSAAGPS
jgi:hypothetical protein